MREEGVWWLPENPGQLSSGTLVIDEGKAALESVLGPLADVDAINPETYRSGPAILHGRSHEGMNFTCEIERVGQGEYHLRVDDGKPRPKESWVKILRECPVKDWWEPLDHSDLLITRDNTRLFEDEGEDES